MTDTSARPPEPGAASSASVKKVLAALLLPLFFIVVFPLMFVSALHNPTPHTLSLLVVGPTQVVGPIADGLDESHRTLVALAAGTRAIAAQNGVRVDADVAVAEVDLRDLGATR